METKKVIREDSSGSVERRMFRGVLEEKECFLIEHDEKQGLETRERSE